jgi:CRISPR-associated protein Cmr2
METSRERLSIAIAWCLAWGEEKEPQHELALLQQMRRALQHNGEIPEEMRSLVKQVEQLQKIEDTDLQETNNINDIRDKYLDLWQQKTRIGLVYGGVTKVKQYVFESAKLPEIRGSSALLDRINLVDLPAFFQAEEDSRFLQCRQARSYCQTVRTELNNPSLCEALIPELIIYSTGGNILALCPAAFIDDLANAIEKRYTQETITANSCAVGDTFRLLEFRLGLLADNFEETKWLDWYNTNKDNELVKAYFDRPDIQDEKELFFSRKSFNELVGKLATKFYQRRNGNDTTSRPSRRYPPILETHPYLVRDGSDRASAVIHSTEFSNKPYFSEPLARKKLVGQIAKRDNQSTNWYKGIIPFLEIYLLKLAVESFFYSLMRYIFWKTSRHTLNWQPGDRAIKGWITRFNENFLDKHLEAKAKYYRNHRSGDRYIIENIKEAQTLKEIGDSCNGFVAYIYADGNNMSGYIQKEIKTAEDYQEFSQDIFEATQKSVYIALVEHLTPRKLKNLPQQKESRNTNGDWIHPFEIITIGGDDVLIIVPADKALQIAYEIGIQFERILVGQNPNYHLNRDSRSTQCHRFKKEFAQPSECKLSTSMGVLITSENTPIYYADKLVSQLLKSAKSKAKTLKGDAEYQYHGGTIDFLSLKSVTMISSNIKEFREAGLTIKSKHKEREKAKILKLYGAPYTLHEMRGLIETVKALHDSNFPRSQLYQIRSLLERGKRTTILNYRYFRVRLKSEEQAILEEHFEKAWCEAKTNDGNIAPWMCDLKNSIYETIWRDLVDIYPFFDPDMGKVAAEIPAEEIPQ